MRTILALIILATVPAFSAIGDHAATPENDAPAPLVLPRDNGDWRMDAAEACLEQMLTTHWDGGSLDLRRILAATGFALSDVTVRDVKNNPSRIRFGFEYRNRDQLKTVYWEADCPVEGFEPSAALASR